MNNQDTEFALMLPGDERTPGFVREYRAKRDAALVSDLDTYWETYSGISVSLKDDGNIHLQGEQVASAVRFIQEYLTYHERFEEAVVLTWAETGTGSFGGGMVVVSYDDEFWPNPWIEAEVWAKSKNLKHLGDW